MRPRGAVAVWQAARIGDAVPARWRSHRWDIWRPMRGVGISVPVAEREVYGRGTGNWESTMKRWLTTFAIGFWVGMPAGAFLWYAFSPLLFDDVVSERLAEAEVVATGAFRDADMAHKGSGTAALVALPGGGHEVQLSEFQVTNGPDLEVWLSAHPDPENSGDVKENVWVSLGRLKGNVGDQAYSVPEGTDIATFKSVVIWCEQFGVLFSPAALGPAG